MHTPYILLYILTCLHTHTHTHTHTACSVLILNDDRREGNESFSIRISADDPSIVFEETRITVIIQDPEDGE